MAMRDCDKERAKKFFDYFWPTLALAIALLGEQEENQRVTGVRVMSRDLPPPINANETKSDNKGLMAKLSKSAGAATKLVALQGERTKLNTLTLPAAYRALGKDCLQQKRHLDCVPELTSQLRSVLAEIKQLSKSATTQDTPQSFTDKAKAAGKYAVDAARQKQLGMKRDSIIAGVGKGIYEQHSAGSGPIELVGPIASSIARIAQIDTEIGQQSAVGNGSLVTPKRMLIGVGIIGSLILVMAGSRLLTTPQGQYNKSDERAVSSSSELSSAELANLQKAVDEGDALYEAGKSGDKTKYDDAFEKYMIVVNSEEFHPDKSIVARVYGRSIDIAASRQKNQSLAKEVAIKCLRRDIIPVCRTPEASQVIEAAQRAIKLEEKETDEWLEREEEKASRGVSRNDDDSNDFDGDSERKNGVVSRPSSSSGYQPSSTPNGTADEAVDAMRRAGTSTPQAERNIREIMDNYEKARKR